MYDINTHSKYVDIRSLAAQLILKLQSCLFSCGISMAKIRNFSLKATQTRKRVQKHRKFKRLHLLYRNEVRRDFERSEVSESPQTSCMLPSAVKHKSPDLKENLNSWVVKHRITQTATSDLLSILNLAGFTFLPKDSRTLMKTPKVVDINHLTTGKLWYHGLRKLLEYTFARIERNLTIHLDFNFDGMPLFNSSKLKFWPMLVAIRGKFPFDIKLPYPHF